MISLNPASGSIAAGGSGRPSGDLVLLDGAGRPRVALDAQDGIIVVRDSNGKDTVRIDGRFALVDIGGPGNEGDLRIFDNAGRAVLTFDANFALLEVGATGNEGDIRVRDDAGEIRIHLDGAAGDIKLFGADCAEEFEVDGGPDVEPGTVLVIGDDERLRVSDRAGDRRVAGVVSGAGGLAPGIRLGWTGSPSGHGRRVPLALSGRVECKVDARAHPVRAGDLLITSTLCGHAMRSLDPRQSLGAILGKALRPLPSGTGLVPVLVALQ